MHTIEPPALNELQIAIQVTGICGSDLHYYSHFANGNIIVHSPMILGHESAGIVEVVGDAVRDTFKVGDKVALEVGVPCEDCEFCNAGRYNICREMRFMSSARRVPHDNGTLRERVNHPARYCHKLPEGASLDIGALAEPFSVALHAHSRSGLKAGSSVLVLGAGTIGILVAGVNKVSGAKQVVVADIDEKRVRWAVKHKFADHGWTVPRRRGNDIDENLQIAREVSQSLEKDGLPAQYDVVFECTGVEACVQAAIYVSTRNFHFLHTLMFRQQNLEERSC